MKKILYFIPVRIAFIEEKEKESFNNKIIEHVRKYQRDSSLSEK